MLPFHLLALMHCTSYTSRLCIDLYLFLVHAVAPPPPAPPPSCVCIWSLHLIKGGSWISTGAESSRFARFAFRRHFIQHEGFRLVRSANPTPVRLCDAEVFVLGAGVSGIYSNNNATGDKIILYNNIMKTNSVIMYCIVDGLNSLFGIHCTVIELSFKRVSVFGYTILYYNEGSRGS